MCSTEIKKLKILITGATGMLGRSILRHLSQPKYDTLYEVTGTCYSRVNSHNKLLHKLNLLNPDEIKTIMNTIKPNIVIHCAAERFPDRASSNPSRTQLLNVQSTLHLTNECKHHNSTMIYISTDYVFDGGLRSGSNNLPPYKTNDITMPINIYGQSKLDGEKAVLSVDGVNSIIVRIPILYALDCNDLAESASLVVAKSLLSTYYKSSSNNNGDETTAAAAVVVVDDWGLRFPTLVDDISCILQQIIQVTIQKLQQHSSPLQEQQHEQKQHDSVKKILHISSNEKCTKYQLTQLMARILNINGSHVKPNSNPPEGDTLRPKNTQLDCSETWEYLGMKENESFEFTSLEDGMRCALLPFVDLFSEERRNEIQ